MIRDAGARTSVGSGIRGEQQQIRQDITQFGRAVSFVRVCSASGRAQRIWLHGAHSTVNWKVRYRTLGGDDVTKRVVAGTYRTSRLAPGTCNAVKMIVSLQPGGDRYDHVFTVRAIPASDARDKVSSWVHITGVLIVP